MDRPGFAVPAILLMQIIAGGNGVLSQSIGPASVVSSGTHATNNAGTFSWSIGQIGGASFFDANSLITAGVQQPDVIWLSLNVRAMLAGPFDSTAMLMADDLRMAGLVPMLEPFSARGFQHAGKGGGEQSSPAILVTSGPNAIVDWIMIELRDPADPQILLSTSSGLLQRDGDVVGMDGSSLLRISAVPGNYHLAVRHRNHLPIRSAVPIVFTTAITVVDFSNGSDPAFGVDPMLSRNGVELLWAGDVTGDHLVKYVNTANDRDTILVHVGGNIPTNVVAGYSDTDVNLDGLTKYAGAKNDRDPILFTIGGTIPTAVRSAQFP